MKKDGGERCFDMCGRYTTDIETDEGELFRILLRAEEETFSPADAASDAASDAAIRAYTQPREVFPSEPAAVLTADPRNASSDLCSGARYLRWGYPSADGKRLIINARSETAAEKLLFSEDLRLRRCIVPTAGFFEWTHTGQRLKYRFNAPGSGLLWLAGLYRPIAAGEQPPKIPGMTHEFVILTTDANASMRPVHSRMPVILRPEHREEWLYDDASAALLLRETPPELVKKWVG